MNAREIIIYLSLMHDGDWDKIYSDIQNKVKNFSDDDIKREISKLKCKCITIIDADYPNELKNIYKPPFVLYYYGDLSLLNNTDKIICSIGTRNPSNYGVNMTHMVLGGLPKDIVVMSGLAAGIDVESHKTAINSGLKTIAVLGSGIDNCYPKENKAIYDEIKNNHLLISEYPHCSRPNRAHFPMRNRILAALSKTVFVTDASTHSGTSITVSFALECGKNVCCIPHHGGEDSLCNKLIKEGAALIEKTDDLLEEIGYKN
ncbi:MAG TPA: DNA-protecting protein DprA [Firmicutes bacterium]|nr:DNA-protecting protein DprA [Bacillota bacterium]